MKTLSPTKLHLALQERELHITWSDGRTTRHSMRELRQQCPCATCRTEREKMQAKGPTLRVIQDRGPQVDEAILMEVIPVGRYALSFLWNDGHQTGIYAYTFLLDHQIQ